MSLTTIVRLTSTATAQRFGFTPHKGRLAVGCDADLVLVDPQYEAELRATELFYRHQQSPYVGMRLRGRVAQTFVRGRVVYRDGQLVDAPIGRFVRMGLLKGQYQ